MSHTTYFLFLCVLTLSHVYIVTSSFQPYIVPIINANIEHLVAHVYSKDNDLGNKTMTVKDAFHWNFRMNLRETTSFAGECFWMDDDNTVLKKANFEVFNKDVATDCG
ncbi:putative plant self-incompatibility S1 [Helianthus anomalus]